MAYLLLLCTVLLFCVQDTLSQATHKGKEFYTSVLPLNHEPPGLRRTILFIFTIFAEKPTKGMVTLRRANGKADSIPFAITDPSKPYQVTTVGNEFIEFAELRPKDLVDLKPLQPSKASIHIIANDDISVSFMRYYRYSSDVSLLYPKQTYSKNYTIIAPSSGIRDYVVLNQNRTRHFYSECAITATENNTVISIVSPTNLIGSTERSITTTLQKGESYLIIAHPDNQDSTADLTGLSINASAPVSVVSGGLMFGSGIRYDRAYVPNDVFEQILPMEYYGQHYIITDPIKSEFDYNTVSPNHYKVAAMIDTASIYVNNKKIAFLKKGQHITLPIQNVAVLYSTSPVAVIILRRSCGEQFASSEVETKATGDPFMVDLPAMEYWQSTYRIARPPVKHEFIAYPFSENFVNIVIPTKALTQLTMNKKPIDKKLFFPLGSNPQSGLCGDYSIGTVSVADEVITLESPVPFGIYCYGYAKSDAYGYVPGRSMNNVSLSHPQVKAIFSDTVVCPGTQVQLQASGGDGTFRWSPKEGLSCTDCPSPTVTAIKDITYTVQSNDYFGCPTLSQKITVRMRQATVKASEDLGICAGDSVQLTVNEGTTYSWTPSNTLSCSDCRSPYARPMARQTYYVTMTDKYGCTGIDSVTVSVGKPIADAGRDTSICAGSSVQMRARGGNYYRWETSPDVSCSDCADPIISPKQSQYYRVRSFISANCYADDSVFITVEQAMANIIAPKVRYCENDSIDLRVEGGTRVQWRGAGITCVDCRDQRFIAPQSGYYYAEITTDNNCTAQDSVYITIHKPQITVSADTTICRGTSANVWARGNGRFIWSPPQGLSCTECSSPSASPTESTEYTVSLYDADNCIASEKVWVYVDSCAIKKQDTITLMASLDCDNISREKIYTHISDIPLTVQSPIFVRGNNNAFLVEYSVPAGTQLSRNENCIITITMKEKTPGNYSAEYIIGEGASTMLVLSIEGKYEEKSANIRPRDTTDIIAGSRIPVRIFMDNSQSGLQDVVTTISYPSRFMKYTSQSLRSIGGGIFSVEKTEEKEGMEYIIIRGKGIENNSSEQEIVRFEADIYLGDSTSFTVLTSTQTPNECYRIAPSKATISMGGCFIEGRTVTTGQPYTMTSRVEDNQLILDYTAGLDGKTEFRLINNMGEIVGEPIQRVDIRGEYQLIYSLSNLANGIYIVNFRSGFYTKNECIMYVR